MLSKFILIVLLLACVTPQSHAQQDSSLFARLARSVTDQRSEWAIAKKRIVPKADIAYYEWKSRKSSVAAMIFIKDSSDAATACLEGFSDLFGETKLTDKLANLGDENYVWKRPYPKGTIGVDFRKGKIAVHIVAGNISDANFFAEMIAAELDAT